MNKKLIALAVAGACAAPMAMAQTANPVTLYGQLRMDLERVEAKGSGGAPARTRITDHPSLLGVRGTEDLGGGLKAFFQLETAFDSDDASGSFANRNSAVGFQGGWGSVMIGRWDTPMKVAIGATDLWGDVNKADYTAGTMDQGNFARRDANVVQYWSPNWGGFSVRLMYQVDEDRSVAGAKPRDWGGSIAWSRGPLYLAYAYEKHDHQSGSTVSANVEEEGNTIGAKFTIGNFILAGNYGRYEKASGAKDKSYYVGGQYNLGKNELILTYQNSDEGARECDVIGAGWRYRFSRRTYTQLSWVDIDNNSSGNCNFGAGGGLGGAGSDPRGIGVGIFHVF